MSKTTMTHFLLFLFYPFFNWYTILNTIYKPLKIGKIESYVF